MPRDTHEARYLERKESHTRQTDAEREEIAQHNDYKAFTDLGHYAKVPQGYQKICCQFVYDVKHDGCHKARLVAGGHLTPPDKDQAYSEVVSLQAMRLAILAGEFNHLNIMVSNIGNAYLESYTNEKVVFTAGPEFKVLECHTLLIFKTLYGLRSSGARFHEALANTLGKEGFVPTKADLDLWIYPAGSCYEYVCVYVDDLLVVMKEPSTFFKNLSKKHGYKLKGVGDPEYHLGGNLVEIQTVLYSGEPKLI